MTSSSSSSPEISAATATDSQDRFSYKHATHDEVLEDLSSRFILNLPDEELASLERICFQVEQAHWFYEDFIREENPKFPSLPLKKFSAMLFHACPLLHQWSHDHEQAFNTFMQYKTRVPVCGAIMLNDTWEKCILVKGWKSSSGWGFPKGKINEDEPEPNCAVREVLEETGYNLAGQIDPEDVIEMSIKEQKISLYIVPGVPEDYPFKTKTRKEISKIEWFKLTDLPTWKRNKAAPGKFYLISPFIGALKAFINERKPRGTTRKGLKAKKSQPVQNGHTRRQQVDVSMPIHSYTPYHDATQESSSQSSSADNGDPHTPSPQYTQSIANHVTHNEHDDNFKASIATEALDPHFARLLSSLTMSATTTIDPNMNDKPALTPLSIKTRESTSQEPSTPVPVTTSSTGSYPLPDPVDQPDWSASAPRKLPDPPRESPLSHEPSPESSVPSHPLINSVRLSQPPAPLLLSPRSNGITGHHSQELALHSAALSSANSTTSSMLSSASPRPRGMTSRRTSSTADISPYLSRPTEIPTSAKRLKQLALLESVADESARMSPFLAHREPAYGRPLNDVNVINRHPFIPGPPASVPPPPSMSHDPNDLRVIYSSGPAATQAATASSVLPTFIGSPRPVHDDPFQVRPRTSHTFHRGPMYPPPPGSVSMNQGQLLALMNGPRGAPAHSQHIYPPPSHIQGHYRHTFYPPTPTSQPHLAPAQRALLPHGGPSQPPLHTFQPHPFPPQQSPHAPLSAPAVSPGFDLPHNQADMRNNAQLLSILNGNKSMQVNTTFPPINSIDHR